jgi:hypothetical protein
MSQPVRHAIARWTVAALLTIAVAYPLSYAPYVRYRQTQPISMQSRLFGGPGETHVFGPIDWLIDTTPLRKPLFLWARVWGVESDFEFARMQRLWGRG